MQGQEIPFDLRLLQQRPKSEMGQLLLEVRSPAATSVRRRREHASRRSPERKEAPAECQRSILGGPQRQRHPTRLPRRDDSDLGAVYRTRYRPYSTCYTYRNKTRLCPSPWHGVFLGRDGYPLKCCGVNFSEFHPECYPIKMPEDNSSRRRERCQEFVRSGAAVRTGCSLGPREQLNQVTSFLDGSTIYGSSSEETERLRSFRGGKLKIQDVEGDDLMPGDEKMVCRNNETDLWVSTSLFVFAFRQEGNENKNRC